MFVNGAIFVMEGVESATSYSQLAVDNGKGKVRLLREDRVAVRVTVGAGW